VQSPHTTTRRRSRAVLAIGAALVAAATGVLAPSSALAVPGSAADARRLVEAAAQQLTVIDEQVHQAELTVAAQQKAATDAAAQAAAARQVLADYEPQLRAIAQSGYTGQSQSGIAVFLTSESAAEVVQQMTTLDMIAIHTNTVVAEVAAAQAAAEDAQAAADEAAATAQAGLAELAEQKAEVEEKAAAYQADLARLSADDRARVIDAVAGPSLQVPTNFVLPPGALGVAIETALAQVGDPYDGGGIGPDVFDCSGLTMYAFAAAGLDLPHSSRAQSQLGSQVARGDLQPGDLVFFYSPISHVGIYLGGGMMVHARTYGSPVAVTSVDQLEFRFGVRLG
jgi:cell wall-associated NlpC family hydrolase